MKVWDRAQESDTFVFCDVMLEKGKEPIAAGQKMVDEHQPLEVVQYEIEHIAVTRNNNADEFSCEHVHELRRRYQNGPPDCR